MGYTTGALKYIAKGPFTNPVAFFIYGSGILAIIHGLTSIDEGLVSATFAYYSTKYLPPTSLGDIIFPILLGSVIAGIRWWVYTPRR